MKYSKLLAIITSSCLLLACAGSSSSSKTWVSSHTARRSFCTNEYLSGTPCDLIMSISGHKTEKAFRKYIKADRIKKASMIKELWDNQPGL